MALPRVRLNDRGVRDVLNSAGVQAALKAKADEFAEAARAAAPVDSGEYRDGITSDVQAGRKRASARVTATDAKSLIIEARFAVLGRAMRGRGRVARTSQVAADRRADRAHNRRVRAEESARES